MTCWGPPKGGLHRPPSSGETTSVENSERLVRVGAALAFLRRSVGPVEKLVSNLPQIYRERLWRELPRAGGKRNCGEAGALGFPRPSAIMRLQIRGGTSP